MINYLSENGSLIVSLMSAVMATLAALIGLTQFRKSKYQDQLNRIQLDHSRSVMEREIERLHAQIYQDSDRLRELNHLLIDSLRNGNASVDSAGFELGASSTSFFRNMGIEPKDITVDSQFVFVLTPLNSRQFEVYETIQEECLKIGLSVRRGDERRIDGPILPHILREIASARLIVANINGRNPNVFYELGIAQALGKPTLMVVKSYDDVPFDLKQQQLVIYDNLGELRTKFRDALSRFAFR